MTPPSTSAGLLSGLFWAGVLVAAGALAVCQTADDASAHRATEPEESALEQQGEVIPTGQVYELANDLIVSEQGQAFRIPFEEDIESNAGEGMSPLVFVEDNRIFKPHKIHAHIRVGEEAMFSHWGKKILFCTGDGSDPRSNGRRYRVILPDESNVVPELAADSTAEHGAETQPTSDLRDGHGRLALAIALGASALALLLSFGGPLLGARKLATAVPICAALAVAVASGWVTAAQWHVLTWPDALRAARAELTVGLDNGSQPVTRPGNTTRLLNADMSRYDVSGLAPAPSVPDPLVLRFEPGPRVQQRQGVVQLDVGDRLVAIPSRPTILEDLTELIVPITVLSGERLRLQVFGVGESRPLQSIVIPIVADPEPQTLRLTGIVEELYGAQRRAAIERLVLSRAANASVSPRIALGDAIASSPQDVYRRSNHGWSRFAAGNDGRLALWQSTPGTITVPWPDGAGELLKGGIAVLGDGAAEVHVAWEDADGVQHPLHSGTLSESAGWNDLRLPLPAGSEPRRLVLDVPTLEPGHVVAWSTWRVVDTSRPPQRVLLTLMDTLRADALSSYGHPTCKTPALDSLAQDGVRFARAFSQCYWTRPSMASLLSGRYVESTGVETLEDRLPAAYDTLAERFAESGFYAVAVVSNTNAGPDAGLDQGWDEFLLQLPRGPSAETLNYLETYVDPQVERLLDEDLLLYVHLMQAHGKYGPWDRPDDFEIPEGRPVERKPSLDRDWLEQPTDAARVALYHYDVEAMDRGFGAFIDRLNGHWDSADGPASILAVMSDHGELLGEEGQWSHGHYRLLPALTHVPMILSAPDHLPRATVISTPVENIDMGATLLELVGARHDGINGRSLRSVIAGDSAGHEVALSGTSKLGGMFAVYREEDGLISELEAESVSRVLMGHPEALPLQPDSGTPSRLDASLHADLRREFEQTWRHYDEHAEAARTELWQHVDTGVKHIDQTAIEQLRELGYIGG